MSLAKISFAGLAVGIAIVACGNGHGDECTKDNDCKSNLTCQPIEGRDKTYCCPTPPESSDSANCHPDQEAIANRAKDAGGGGG
jgi:hypothetical protein